MGNQIDDIAGTSRRPDKSAIADRIRATTAALNDALFDAAEAGLICDVTYSMLQSVGGAPSYVVRTEVMERL